MTARARPEDWYRLRRVGDDVTHIDEPHIREFYRCNIWHVRGRDRDLLVDSGMGVVSLTDWVPLVTERPLDAVASHTHFDHIGSHHEFPNRLVHQAEAALLAAPTRANTLADPYVTDAIFHRLPPAPYASTTYAVRAAPATRLLDDGDTIDLGDRAFEVIHSPGHSPGGIALWEAATGHRLRRPADRGRLPLRCRRLTRQHGAPAHPARPHRPRRPLPELFRRPPQGDHYRLAPRQGVPGGRLTLLARM